MRLRSSAIRARLAVVLLVLLGGAPPAGAFVTAFEAWVVFEDEVQGGEVWVPISITEVLSPSGITVGMVEDWKCITLCQAGGFQIDDLDLMLDPDPVISFGTSVIDFGAPSPFGFVFMQAIVPTPAPGVATASLSGSTTNGGGAPGSVSVTPLAPPAGITEDPGGTDEIMVYSLSTNSGASWINAALDLGPAFTSNPALVSDAYGPFNEGPIAGPALSGFYDMMRVDVNFQLSGGNDTFTFNGDATIVPEPAAAALLGLGLASLGLARRRR